MRPLASRLLDPFFPLAFGAPGFRLAARGFEPADLDVDLTGRVCLVTGANAGIGRATAEALAARGATVHLLCRDRARGEEARADIAARTRAPGAVVLDVVDVADRAALRAYVAERAPARVDALIHNAGVLPHERIETKDGFELTYATNLLGPYLLTELLAPRLGRGARVVFVASGGALTQRLDLAVLTAERREVPFDGTVAYAQTKRAEIILAAELAETFRARGVFVASMHPGWVDTRSLSTSLPRFYALTRTLLRDASAGADTVVWLAVSTRLGASESGRFFFDREARDPYPLFRTRESPADREALLARLAHDARA